MSRYRKWGWEQLLQIPMSTLVTRALNFNMLPGWGWGAATFDDRLAQCTPDITFAKRMAAAANADDVVMFSCHLPTSSFCIPDSVVYTLADE
jgi:hypothetical protein